MHIPFVDLNAQYQNIKAEVDAAMQKVVDSCAFILGPAVSKFEKDFSEYLGAKHAIGVDSGTQAIELALRASGLQAGDEVIVPANTFIASTLPISRLGAIPVLVDVDPQTYNVDPAKIERAITPKTKVILPVHLYGQPVNQMEKILKITEAHDLILIEDACQAHGARYKGKRVGTFGKASAFSFYPGKNLGGYGDGGMVVTNDDEIAHQVKQLRNYGQTKKYHHDQLGFNHRLDSIQAAVLDVKLKYLDSWNAARRKHALEYINALRGTEGLILPHVPVDIEPVWHIFSIRVQQRDKLMKYLEQHGISTGIHYPIPIHLQLAYADLHYHVGDFPITEKNAMEQLSLPMYAELTSEMVLFISGKIKEFLGQVQQ